LNLINHFFLVYQFWGLRVVAYPIEIRKGYVLDNCLPLGSESAQQPFDLWNAVALEIGVKVCEVLSISSLRILTLGGFTAEARKK